MNFCVFVDFGQLLRLVELRGDPPAIVAAQPMSPTHIHCKVCVSNPATFLALTESSAPSALVQPHRLWADCHRTRATSHTLLRPGKAWRGDSPADGPRPIHHQMSGPLRVMLAPVKLIPRAPFSSRCKLHPA